MKSQSPYFEKQSVADKIMNGIANLSLTAKKLVLEILSNGDDIVLKRIAERDEIFFALVETQGEQAGMKWDDLIIRFEWTFDVEDILKNLSATSSEKIINVIERASQELKFSFNR